jgi:hypothetical protein
MSALPPKADTVDHGGNVRSGPGLPGCEVLSKLMFDHLTHDRIGHVSYQSYFTGIRTGASLSLSKITKNLAGIVSLALRPTV